MQTALIIAASLVVGFFLRRRLLMALAILFLPSAWLHEIFLRSVERTQDAKIAQQAALARQISSARRTP